jgi:hypothetical protein
MKHRTVVLTLVMLLVLVGVVYAADNLEIQRHLFGSGGGSTQSGEFTIHASIGQAVTGQSESTPYRLESGFWPGLVRMYVIHLPIILHSVP